MNLPRALLIKIIRLYQAVTVRRLPVCRFDPSCSSYAIEAVSQHGASKGAWYAMRRIARCHPWGGWGYDPVPLPNQRVEV
ncbi:MAG: membrane protein insertion efficiency factor YidD [Candidatus Poriferisodalaceae bacterium]|nr:membrane protein insertion efficiency factor YidD [Acidimicrobiaceae bacterium]OUW87200.1 MAG: membrane protein insertion efficiency factor YidD [Acidimicrobiaceae bacterium TMED224]HBQ04894.1 membrane protein insertion efficiency factor YidD [Acidimicrobiaceae bacterium]